MNCPHCGGKIEKQLVKIGDRFQGDMLMEVAHYHETLKGDFWCRGVGANIGLWVYSSDFILKNLCK